MPRTGRRDIKAQHCVGNSRALPATSRSSLRRSVGLTLWRRGAPKPRDFSSARDRRYSLLLSLGISLQTLFLHFAEDIAHIVDFVPHILADVNWRLLLGSHRDAIARSSIQLDDLLLL